MLYTVKVHVGSKLVLIGRSDNIEEAIKQVQKQAEQIIRAQ